MRRDPDTLDLYVAHRGALVNYADRILGDRAHAEDVVQEAYLRLDAAAEERALAEPLAYLYRIVRNLALDVRRRVRRDRDRIHPQADELLGNLRQDAPEAEDALAAREELRLLAAAMAELPDDMRAALEMHRFGGCSIRETPRVWASPSGRRMPWWCGAWNIAANGSAAGDAVRS